MTEPTPAEPADTTPLEDALAKNVDATEEVKRATDELTVIRAVLDNFSHAAEPGDIAMASRRAEEVEEDLSSATEKLEQVNETLAEEVRAGGTRNG